MATYDYDVEYSKNYVLETAIKPETSTKKEGKISIKDDPMMKKLKEIAQDYPDDEFDFVDDDILMAEEETPDITFSTITKPVHIGEKCTIEFAKRLNIFDNNNYILNLSQDELDKLNTYELDDNGNLVTSSSQYNICSVEENIAYENCALATSNVYLATVYDKASQSYVCSLPDNMKLPQNSKYQFVLSSSSNIIKPESEIYLKNLKKNFCEERWHDWFSIPNFHLNNRWFNEIPNELSSTKSVGKCFKPCKFGYMPTQEDIGKCVLKKQYNGGQYKYDFDYTPIALVCLLGTTFNVFVREYTIYLETIRKNYNASAEIELLKNKEQQDVIEHLKSTIGIKENVIWSSIQNDLKTYINDVFTNIPDMNNDIINTNVVVPNTVVINQMKTYLTQDQIRHAYTIAKDIQSYMGDLEKYKTWVSELASISGLSSDKLIYLIRMLKRACNICFDGKNAELSSNYLLFAINEKPVIIDETYEPYIQEITVNNFNYLQKKERWYFDDYVNDFKSYQDALYTFLYFVVVVLGLFILYVIYIVFYKHINQVLNSVITLVVFMYFDIKYILYRYLIDSYAVDDREYQKLTFIKKFYEAFRMYDTENYLR